MNFWFVGSGFGTVDIYGAETVNSTNEIDELVNGVRAVDYFIEIEWSTAIGRYLQVADK